jgi:DNA polymerase sigma
MKYYANHLGIKSTQTVNKWLREIPTLQYIVLTLKLLLQSRGFNKTYEGGMNTFSLIIFLVSYILEAKLDKETNPALVL